MIQLGLAVTQGTSSPTFYAKMEAMLQPVRVTYHDNNNEDDDDLNYDDHDHDDDGDDDDCSIFEAASQISPVQENTSDDDYGP